MLARQYRRGKFDALRATLRGCGQPHMNKFSGPWPAMCGLRGRILTSHRKKPPIAPELPPVSGSEWKPGTPSRYERLWPSPRPSKPKFLTLRADSRVARRGFVLRKAKRQRELR